MQKHIVSNLRNLLKEAQRDLKSIRENLSKQEITIKNKKYFALLDKGAKIENRILNYKKQLKTFNRLSPRKLIVSVGSKVQLFSDKIGGIIYVDAVNYFELIGKKVGDLVTMDNYTFMISGVY